MRTKQKYYLTIFILFFIALIIRMIKANYFLPWGVDEIDAVKIADSFETALRWYKWQPMPPFHLILDVVFKLFSHGSIFWQRFPTILAGALMVPLFYSTLRHFLPKTRWPIIFSLLPLTSFILIYYSQEIRSYSYFWLLILATFYYGYKVFIEESKNNFDLMILFFAFALLPIVHYIAIQYLFVFDLAFLVMILLFNKNKIRNILKLAAINLLIPISYINWADSAYYLVIKRTFLIGRLGDSATVKPFRVDGELFWATFDKVVGGHEWWAYFLFAFSLFGILILIIRAIKSRFQIDNFEKFIWFSVFYSFFLFVVLFFTKSSEPLIARHYLFILWPFLFIFCYSLLKIWDWHFWPAKIFVIFVLAFFIVNNSVNTVFYFLSSHRFFADARPAAKLIESLITSNKKRLVYSEIGDYSTFVPFFQNPQQIPKESILFSVRKSNKEDSESRERLDPIQQLIDCCGEETIFIFSTNSKQREIFWPDVNFGNLKQVKQFAGDRYLDYLVRIDAAPYGRKMDQDLGYGTYMVAY